MNSRLKDFENLITRPDGSVDDIFSENQRETNELEQLITMNPQQAYQLSTSIQAQHDSLDVGIKAMRNSFGKGVSEVLKEKPVAANLTKYQNVLPYGVEEIPAGTNLNRPPLKQDVNAGLENLDPSLTKNIHSYIYDNQTAFLPMELLVFFHRFPQSSIFEIDPLYVRCFLNQPILGQSKSSQT